MSLVRGQILNNRYRIEELLGQGGFGAVYKAWDLNLERWRALKENLDASPEAQRQFKREAQILCDLAQPNLPRVIDYFVIPDPTGGSGSAYLVMDFVEGEDLEKMLEHNHEPLPEAQVIPWLFQVCDALEYLHNQQPPVIHRDIKPANIKITPSGKAMLVDFGIAKLFDPSLKTTIGARACTPGYSPPEQYGSGTTDAQSDIFALGATAYHLLTGSLPPDSMDVVSGSAARLRLAHDLNPSISPQLSEAVERAMQLNRANRWRSVAEFKKALIPSPDFGRGDKGARDVVQPAQPLARTLPLETTTTGSPTHRRSQLWIGGLGGLALVSLVVLGLAIWGLSSLLTPPPSASIIDKKGVPMALVPAGEFQMGSDNGSDDEKPVHTVYLDAFYIDVYEVTNARYLACVSSGACQPPSQSKSYNRSSYYGEAQYADYPVIYVTWEMAKAYCEWRGGSLPSEAQWEKAARGGLPGMDYPWGNDQPVCDKGAQNGANFGDCAAKDTEPAGSYSPNGYGLFDMAGNVWEWVDDWYQSNYYASSPASNPTGPGSGDYKVLRGGSWNVKSHFLRVAFRGRFDPYLSSYSVIGFRCAVPPGN
jgi:formylglycine-generating enzyme required for sulfatase activity